MMAVPKTYYQILQVDPKASQEVISAAYRRLARIYHPDVNNSRDAVTRMRTLNQAYEVLNDPTARAKYDALLAVKQESQPKSAPRTPRRSPDEARSARSPVSVPTAKLKRCRHKGGYIYFSIGKAKDFYATLDAFKSRVPRSKRQYFPKSKEWRVPKEYGSVLSDLFTNYRPPGQSRDIGPSPDPSPSKPHEAPSESDGGWTPIRVVAVLVTLALVAFCAFNPDTDEPAFSDPTPTERSASTSSPTSTPTRWPTRRPTRRLTSTPRRASHPYAVIRSDGNLNLRAGPGTGYTVLGKYRPGIRMRLYGRTPGSRWLKVLSPDAIEGWMHGDYLEPSVPLASLPYVEAPPPPAPPSPVPQQSPVCSCSGNNYDCDSFSTQHSAQRCFEYCWGKVGYDIHWLDGDGDGVACEWNP